MAVGVVTIVGPCLGNGRFDGMRKIGKDFGFDFAARHLVRERVEKIFRNCTKRIDLGDVRAGCGLKVSKDDIEHASQALTSIRERRHLFDPFAAIVRIAEHAAQRGKHDRVRSLDGAM